MKKFLIGLMCVSVVYSSNLYDNSKNDCIEDFENEIINIIKSNKEDGEKKIELKQIKQRLKEKDHPCSDELKNKNSKDQNFTADVNSLDCIENFEDEIFKILNKKDNKDVKIILHQMINDKNCD